MVQPFGVSVYPIPFVCSVENPALLVEKPVDNVDNWGKRLWITLCTSVNKCRFCTGIPVISRLSEMKTPLRVVIHRGVVHILLVLYL